MTYCVYCGNRSAEEARFCPKCGRQIPVEPVRVAEVLASEDRTCGKCGKPIGVVDRECWNCGSKAFHESTRPSQSLSLQKEHDLEVMSPPEHEPSESRTRWIVISLTIVVLCFVMVFFLIIPNRRAKKEEAARLIQQALSSRSVAEVTAIKARIPEETPGRERVAGHEEALVAEAQVEKKRIEREKAETEARIQAEAEAEAERVSRIIDDFKAPKWRSQPTKTLRYLTTEQGVALYAPDATQAALFGVEVQSVRYGYGKGYGLGLIQLNFRLTEKTTVLRGLLKAWGLPETSEMLITAWHATPERGFGAFALSKEGQLQVLIVPYDPSRN